MADGSHLSFYSGLLFIIPSCCSPIITWLRLSTTHPNTHLLLFLLRYEAFIILPSGKWSVPSFLHFLIIIDHHQHRHYRPAEASLDGLITPSLSTSLKNKIRPNSIMTNLDTHITSVCGGRDPDDFFRLYSLSLVAIEFSQRRRKNLVGFFFFSYFFKNIKHVISWGK